jgi:hypothetical protein
LKIPGTLSVPSANPRKMHSCFAGLGLILPLDLQRITESRIFQKSALKDSSEGLVLFGFAPNTLGIESTPNTSPLRRPLPNTVSEKQRMNLPKSCLWKKYA